MSQKWRRSDTSFYWFPLALYSIEAEEVENLLLVFSGIVLLESNTINADNLIKMAFESKMAKIDTSFYWFHLALYCIGTEDLESDLTVSHRLNSQS